MARFAAPGSIFGLLLLAALPAGATTRKLPAQHVHRDLVTPAGTVRLDGGPRWTLPTGQLVHHVNRGARDRLWLVPGASFGVVRDLELGFNQPIRLTGDTRLENPLFHGTYQLTRGVADVGIFWAVNVPFRDHLVTRAGVPLYLHVGDRVRLDTGGFLRVGFPDGALADLEIPFLVPINVTRRVFLGPETAIITYGGLDGVAVPLGFFVGGTITTGGGVLGDLSGRFRSRDIDNGLDAVELIFAADLYFDL